MSTSESTFSITTQETQATKPARRAVLQSVADMSDRRLTQFHWSQMEEAVQKMQHTLHDYSEEDSPFRKEDAKEVIEAARTIITNLMHIRAIVDEGAAASVAVSENDHG